MVAGRKGTAASRDTGDHASGAGRDGGSSHHWEGDQLFYYRCPYIIEYFDTKEEDNTKLQLASFYLSVLPPFTSRAKK